MLDQFAAHGIDCDPAGLLDYVYAVLNWPGHRQRYADALRYEFARIPFARDPAPFGRIRAIGADLVQLHLLEHPQIAQALPALDGVDDESSQIQATTSRRA